MGEQMTGPKRKAPSAAQTTNGEASRLSPNTSQNSEESKPFPYPVGRLWFKGLRIGVRHGLSFETPREILFKDLSLICIPGRCVFSAARPSLQEGL